MALRRLCLCALLLATACSRQGTEDPAATSPGARSPGVVALAGAPVRLADGSGKECSASGGRIVAAQDGVFFIAPPEPGSWKVTCGPDRAALTVRVEDLAPLEVAITTVDGGLQISGAGISGRAHREADGAGSAHLELDDFGSVDVRVGPESATVDLDGLSLAGAGPLDARQRAALQRLADSGGLSKLALSALDAACAGPASDVAPAAAAALLAPLQLALKHLVVDRPAAVRFYAQRSRCDYFLRAGSGPKPRPDATLVSSPGGRTIPVTPGFWPLDGEGAAEFQGARQVWPTAESGEKRDE